MKRLIKSRKNAEASAAQYTTLILALGLLAAAPSSLIAGTPFTPFPISTIDDHGEVAPRIDGRYVAWTELEQRGVPNPAIGNDVLGYDLQTHQAFPIATGSAEQDSGGISGDLAVWYEGGDIFAKHLSPGGGVAFNVTPFASEQSSAAVSGNLIVWTDSRFAHQTIWGRYADQPASSTFQISSTAAYEQITSDVSGKIVVWATYGEPGDGQNIYGRDLSGAINGGAIFPICTEPGAQENPHVSGNIAIWEDSRSGRPQIYGKNLITGVEFPVSEGGTADQIWPQIDGNIVVWQDLNFNGTRTWDVWARDLSSGGPAFPVTDSTDYSEQYVDVSGNTVVWSQTGGDIFEGDIYGTVIPEPSAAAMSVAAAACLAAYVASRRNRLPRRLELVQKR